MFRLDELTKASDYIQMVHQRDILAKLFLDREQHIQTLLDPHAVLEYMQISIFVIK